MSYPKFLKVTQFIGVLLLIGMFILARFPIETDFYNAIIWTSWGLFLSIDSLLGIILLDKKEMIEYAQNNNPDFIYKFIPTNIKTIALIQYLIFGGSLLMSIFFGIVPLIKFLL